MRAQFWNGWEYVNPQKITPFLYKRPYFVLLSISFIYTLEKHQPRRRSLIFSSYALPQNSLNPKFSLMFSMPQELGICFFLSKFLGVQSPFDFTIRSPKVQRKMEKKERYQLQRIFSFPSQMPLYFTNPNITPLVYYSPSPRETSKWQLHRFVSPDLNQLKHIVHFSISI